MNVYVIGMAGTRYFKIGVASDPVARMADMQVGNPVPLELLYIVRGGTDLETHLHGRLAKRHVRGEWFKHDPGVALRIIHRAVRGWYARRSERPPPVTFAQLGYFYAEIRRGATIVAPQASEGSVSQVREVYRKDSLRIVS